jgi:hypothetical protein
MPSVQDPPVITISSLELSWLAEKADGTRDEDLALVKDENGNLQIRQPPRPGEAPEKKPGDVLIANVRTKGTCKRERVAKITIDTEHGGKVEFKGSDKGADALFWTDSAVEKFLYPYYYSQRIWNEDMDRLRTQFSTDPQAIAVLHRAPSTSETLSPNRAIEVARVKSGAGGMVPKVEWVALAAYLMEKSNQPR